MKVFEFGDTSIPAMFQVDLRENFAINWIESRSADFYRMVFTTMADVLKINQSKDCHRIGLSIKDDKGNFKIGAILVYQKPEDGAEDDTGNWYLQMTFDENDMTDLDLSLDNHSDIYVRCAANEAQNICYGRFRSIEIMYNMINTAIDCLIKFLDKNATEGEEIEVRLHGIFSASATIENGVKVFAIVPGESIKQIIKNDSAL